MKYELNTPYDFEVRNVVQGNDSLTFEIEVGGNLFPVKAYPEQIEEVVPKTVSCRIMLDKNENAYLIQNEAFLYPFLYKPERRYIFEVADIRDGYVVLKDKHGLFHAMELDGTKLSVNEIIVRCVNVIVDKGDKAHLSFYYTDIVVEEQKQEYHDLVSEEPKVRPKYAPTIFEEDAPKVKVIEPLPSPKVASTETSFTIQENSKIENKENGISVSALIKDKNWSQLSLYFDKNLGKAKTPVILKEITAFIENCISGKVYWEAVRFLISYDAHSFLGTIAKVDTSHIFDISENVNPNLVDDVVRKAFNVSDKLKFALDIIAKCAKYLTTEQKNFIQSKCVDLNTPESLFSLFKVLRLTPDDAIVYLLSLKDNIAAAFTIYKFYSIGKNGNIINERSQHVSFRPSKINEYTRFMVKMQSYPFAVSANLIDSIILAKEHCPFELRKVVEQNDYKGFYTYVSSKRQKMINVETKRTLESLTVGDVIDNLIYKSQTDNYYVLRSQELGVFVLLDKKLTKVVPNNENQSSVRIVKVMIHKSMKWFAVAQKSIPSMYKLPPIFENDTLFDVVFHQSGNSRWQPSIKKYGFIIDTEFDDIPYNIDKSAVHKARILKRKNFFTYQIHIIEPVSSPAPDDLLAQLAIKFRNKR